MTARARRARATALALAGLLLSLPACASWFFSGLPEVDRSTPVALVETTGGVEYGATTELGVLLLGRTAQTGPCRVHWFLGTAPIVDDGALETAGPAFTRARVDLRTQYVRVHDQPLTAADDLVAMYTPDGTAVVKVGVALADLPGVTGEALADPGVALPAGAAVFVATGAGLRCCGLVSGRATLAGPDGEHTLYTLAGIAAIRALLATPVPFATEPEVRHRPDGITVVEPGK